MVSLPTSNFSVTVAIPSGQTPAIPVPSISASVGGNLINGATISIFYTTEQIEVMYKCKPAKGEHVMMAHNVILKLIQVP
jgi:hypothetical protein